MMWIWYLLLGSGSGSRTVGKYLKQAETKVSGGCFFSVTEPIRSAARSRWEKGGMENSLKCGGCAASFSSHSLNLLVHNMVELTLLFISIGSEHIFWPQIESCGSPVSSVFFPSLSNPFLLERVPFTPVF